MKEALSYDPSFYYPHEDKPEITFLRGFILKIMDEIDEIIIDKIEECSEIFKKRGDLFKRKWIFEKRKDFYDYHFDALGEIIKKITENKLA